MNAKLFKVLTGGMIAASMLAAALPVSADELTQDNPSGEMNVQGTVAEEPETASYVITVPTTVDFGNLRQPAANASSPVNANLAIECTQYSLSNSNQAVAVLLRDNSSTDQKFYMTGVDDSNKGKTLNYSVLIDNIDIETRNFNPTTGGAYINDLNGTSGYLYCVFHGTGASNGTLSLDQQQLYGVNISDYEGMFKGTVTVATTIVNAADYQG